MLLHMLVSYSDAFEYCLDDILCWIQGYHFICMLAYHIMARYAHNYIYFGHFKVAVPCAVQ